MKSRLGLVAGLAAFAILTTVLVAVVDSPAQAAPFGARLSRTPPIVGETVRIYGAVTPAKRPVTLQKLAGGRWVAAGSSHTAAGGAYSFNVKGSAAAVSYRVFAPKKKIKHKKAPARTSNVVRVQGVRPSLTLAFVPAAVGIATAGNAPVENLLTPGVATFRPARPGAVVTIQRLINGSWTTVLGGTGRQDATGSFKFKGIAAGSDSDPRTFRAVSAPGAGGVTAFSPSVRPTYWASSFDDNFSDPSVSNAQWYSRPSAPDTNRTCMYPYQEMFQVGDGVAKLETVKQNTNTSPQGASCPDGFWKTAVVGTAGNLGAGGTPTFRQKYGIFAVRMKVHSSLGAHGGFWLQGVGPQSAEVDMEYFGDGRADGGFTNFIHLVNGSTIKSYGGLKSTYKSIIGAGRDLSGDWHVYSIQWSPSGYVFRVDGVPTFATTRTPTPASVPEELMLSLVTSSYEVPSLKKAGKTSVSLLVDWVRAWSYPGA